MRDKFSKEHYWGACLAMDILNCDENIITSEELIKTFVQELCIVIDMRPYKKTTVYNFGDDPAVRGITFFQAIQTSSILGHCVNATNNAYVDIFTCKDFDTQKAKLFTQEFFKAKNCKTHMFYRHNHN